MADSVNTRELITDMLVTIDKGEEMSHILIRNVLDKYNYLPSIDKAFIKRVTEGTLERRITIDYVINDFSNTPVNKMKPYIRNLIRMSVYQIMYMDKVPESAACNEAVKLANKHGFNNLSGFVNGVLRNIVRNKEGVVYPDEKHDLIVALSVKYSCPEIIVNTLIGDYGIEETKKILKSFLKRRNLYVRIREDIADEQKDMIKSEWHESGIGYEKSEFLPYAYALSTVDNLAGMFCFKDGLYTVQDLSSMMVAEIASPKADSVVLDICGAPGGKSLHVATKMRKVWRNGHMTKKLGTVICRDVTENKVDLIRQNVERMRLENIKAECFDATVFDPAMMGVADIVLADVPCSGLGVIGKKPDIKYNVTEESLNEICTLQKKIIDNAVKYVKRGGALVYSTCTIRNKENEDMINYILNNYDFVLDNVKDYVPPKLMGMVQKSGALKLMPYDDRDGFFIARFIRNGH